MRKISQNVFNAFEKSKEGRKNIFMVKIAETFIKCRNVANIGYYNQILILITNSLTLYLWTIEMTSKNDILSNVALITKIEKKVNESLINTVKRERDGNVINIIVWKRYMMNWANGSKIIHKRGNNGIPGTHSLSIPDHGRDNIFDIRSF